MMVTKDRSDAVVELGSTSVGKLRLPLGQIFHKGVISLRARLTVFAFITSGRNEGLSVSTRQSKSPQHTAILSLSVEDVVQRFGTHSSLIRNGNLLSAAQRKNYRGNRCCIKLRKNRHGLPDWHVLC